jgi:ribonuclease R
MKRSRARVRTEPRRRRRDSVAAAAAPATGYAALLAALRRADGPVTVPQLIRQLGLDEEAEPALRAQMELLERRGVLFAQRRGRWAMHSRARVAVGRLVSPQGTYGFVTREDGEGPDLFIPPGRRHGAGHGDRVLARVTDSGRDPRGGRGGRAQRGAPAGPAGEILAVLESRSPRIAALFVAQGSGGTLLPRDERLGQPMVVHEVPEGVPDGAVVWAERVGPEDRHRPALGRIVSVAGLPEEPDVRLGVIDRLYELPGPFPAEVEREAKGLPGQVTEQDRAGREDFTGQLVVTIDPAGARDHDDAVGLEVLATPNGEIFRLSVHIADVAHYVTEGSALDAEALRRGTSVYFPGRHIPMLPPTLSSGICSLVAGADRLTQTVVMDFDAEGRRVAFRFTDGIIRSRADLTYERALELMEAREAPAGLGEQHALLHGMERLRAILRARRMQRGSLDLDLPETTIDLDARGQPVGVRVLEHTRAHQAIEEFMLAANETVASWLSRGDHATLYRIHEDPDPAEIDQLEEELLALGFPLRHARGTASVRLRAVLEQARGIPEERAIAMMVLRTLKLARYSPDAVGHFGLAAPLYTHFTSPIRRYPDLVVHRVLRGARRHGKLRHIGTMEGEDRLTSVALECSMLERRAEEAERAMEAWQEAIYMKGRIGESFEGVVTGRSRHGLFVTLDGIGVEGLLPLPPSPRQESARGGSRRGRAAAGRRGSAADRRKGRAPDPAPWKLGDRVRVRVHDVDTFRARILLKPLLRG